jgi:NADH-quinone oxidoreductase subunit G
MSLPPAFEPRAGEWLCLPLHEIFGSEELSALAPAVAVLTPRPYVALNDDDLRRIGVAEGEEVAVVAAGSAHRLHARRLPSLPTGVAGIGAGLPSASWMALPARARIAAVAGR